MKKESKKGREWGEIERGRKERSRKEGRKRGMGKDRKETGN